TWLSTAGASRCSGLRSVGKSWVCLHASDFKQTTFPLTIPTRRAGTGSAWKDEAPNRDGSAEHVETWSRFDQFGHAGLSRARLLKLHALELRQIGKRSESFVRDPRSIEAKLAQTAEGAELFQPVVRDPGPRQIEDSQSRKAEQCRSQPFEIRISERLVRQA